jgi:hypothetical protein
MMNCSAGVRCPHTWACKVPHRPAHCTLGRCASMLALHSRGARTLKSVRPSTWPHAESIVVSAHMPGLSAHVCLQARSLKLVMRCRRVWDRHQPGRRTSTRSSPLVFDMLGYAWLSYLCIHPCTGGFRVVAATGPSKTAAGCPVTPCTALMYGAHFSGCITSRIAFLPSCGSTISCACQCRCRAHYGIVNVHCHRLTAAAVACFWIDRSAAAWGPPKVT